VTREQLAHVLRAASTIAGEPDVLVIGSQSVLGSFTEGDLPHEATASMEVDVAFFDDPRDAKTDLVDGAIGELSGFHDTPRESASARQSCLTAGGTASSPSPPRARLQAAGYALTRTTA
jgi:hypothetical protein